MSALSACSIAVHDVFGPAVAASCADGFDFTLLFEESILTLLPLGAALGWALLRFWILRNHVAKVRASWLLPAKMALYALYVVLQAALLGVWLGRGVPTTRATVASLAVAIFAYLVLAAVSYLEHMRSLRPSTLLSLFLAIGVLVDMARVRTLFLFPYGGRALAGLYLGAYLAKVLLLALESVEKGRLLRPDWAKASPEDLGGFFNRAFFGWVNGNFVRGFRGLLTIGSLTDLDEELLTASSPTALTERWEKASKTSDYALVWTFLAHYKATFWTAVIPRLAYTGFSYSQPYLIQRVLDLTSEPGNPEKRNYGYGLVGAYAVVYVGMTLSYAIYQHKTYRLLTLFRGSLVTLIFNKTLRISSSSVADAEAITLMSADIDRIGAITLIHEFYASFLEAAVALYLLYDLLGLGVVAPVAWIVVCLIAGMPLAKAAGDAQVPWLEAIEDRLAITSKALNAMKPIKMTGLADIVSDQIATSRLDEIRASLRHRVLAIFVSIASFASSGLAPVWGFLMYILLAESRGTGTLTQGTAFAALSAFELLTQPMNHAIDGYEHVVTVLNSFRRIQEYLLSEERDDYRRSALASSAASDSSLSEKEQLALGDEKTRDYDAPPYGLDPKTAAVVRDASAGYSEEKGNVLNGLGFDVQRAQTTMIYGPVGSGKSTLLKLLLGEMPLTTGSVSIDFAKAAYCPQTPWITWGTVQQNIVGMSAMDRAFYDRVVECCALRPDFDELPEGDQTHAGIRGSRLSGGQQMRVSLARALYSRNSTMLLDDVLTGLDRATERGILDTVFGSGGLLKQMKATVVLTTNSLHHLQYADYIILLDKDGKIAQQGTPDAVSLTAGGITALDDDAIETSRAGLEIPEDVLHELEALDDQDTSDTRRAGDTRIYLYYAKTAGYWRTGIYLLACCAFVYGSIFPGVWLQWWTNANEVRPNDRVGYWLGVYGALAVVTLIGALIADCLFNLSVLPTTARKFHEMLLNTTMRAPTSFVTSTNAGTTLNRFSQDLELIDNDLPMAIDQTVFQFLSVIASAVLVFIGSGYVAAAVPLTLVALVVIQFYYLRTSRQLRLLDIEAKAPLFSQFLETINGIACVRAYGWTRDYMGRNVDALNRSQKPFYLMWCIQRWLTLVLDLLNAGIAVLLVGVALNVENGSTAFLGVALFNVIALASSLQTLITEWTQVETALGAMRRIKSYVATTEDENLETETGEVPEEWPARGTIAFKDISASYQSSTEPVLKDMSFSIEDGEKVAICGRTGSGKSSLISALLRMLDLERGSITVDGIDISTIPRQAVRGRINTVPQDPFFLHGDVRLNVDPTGSVDDERIIEVLRTLDLWRVFEEHDGLDGEIDDGTLSHGQRQLFCLARAMLKPGRIVVMDEATSSVDADTDELMQRVLREELQGRTIITIAHKLHTVLDYDRVILLDKGRILEMGNPQELLKKPASPFRELYERIRGAETET